MVEFLHHLTKPRSVVRPLFQTGRRPREGRGSAIERGAFDAVRASPPGIAIRILQGPTCPIDLGAHQRGDVASEDVISLAAMQ